MNSFLITDYKFSTPLLAANMENKFIRKSKDLQHDRSEVSSHKIRAPPACGSQALEPGNALITNDYLFTTGFFVRATSPLQTP